jgi:hypothetical protein
MSDDEEILNEKVRIALEFLDDEDNWKYLLSSDDEDEDNLNKQSNTRFKKVEDDRDFLNELLCTYTGKPEDEDLDLTLALSLSLEDTNNNEVGRRIDPGEFSRAVEISVASKTAGRQIINGRTAWSTNRYDFRVVTNNGGPRAVDCGILAIKDAARLLTDFPSDVFFAGTPTEIRGEMIRMFMDMDPYTRTWFARQYLTDISGDLVAKMTDALRTQMLHWQTLVYFINWRYPGMVNALVWKQLPDGFVHESPDPVDPSLPLLHIVHWKGLHFEALEPVDVKAVEKVIKDKVTDAKTYEVEIEGKDATLVVAPHPLEPDMLLLQFHDRPDVYRFSNEAIIAIMLAVTPYLEKDVNHFFDFTAAKQMDMELESRLEQYFTAQLG